MYFYKKLVITYKEIIYERLTLYRFLAVLLTATIIFASCKKEQSNVRLNPKLSTTQVLNVKSDSATVVGFCSCFR